MSSATVAEGDRPHSMEDAMVWLEARSLEGADHIMEHVSWRTLLVLRGVRGVVGMRWLMEDMG